MTKCSSEAQRHGSLFTRLLLIFSMAAIGVILCFGCSFALFSDKPFKSIFKNNVNLYTKLIVDNYIAGRDPKIFLKDTQLSLYTNQSPEVPLLIEQFKDSDSEIIGKSTILYHDHDRILIKTKYKNQSFYITSSKDHEKNFFFLIFGFIGSLIILIITHHKVKKTFRPLKMIQAGAQRIGEGNLDEQIPVTGKFELASLTTSINNMSIKIKNMFIQKQTLLLTMGHELKTPLARLRILSELIPTNRKDELIEEIQEMEYIVNSLLEAERVKQGLMLENVDLNSFLTTLGVDELILPTTKINYPIDSVQFNLMFNNLIENAKKYSVNAPFIKIKLSLNEDILIELSDNGPGVPEDDLQNLILPFYRPDEARTRSDGGTGLGLYLAHTICKSHDGTLTLSNLKPGLMISIRLKKNIIRKV